MPGDMDKDKQMKQAGVAAAKRKVSTVFRKLNVWQERDDLKGMPRIGRFVDMSVQVMKVEGREIYSLDYFEEAAAIADYLRRSGVTQEEAAAQLGRSASAVANKLRLLRLSPACGELLRKYELTERHARALLRLEGEDVRLAALRHIGEKKLTVAASEEYIELQLQKKQMEGKEKKRLYIIKDVRLFLNSVDRGMETIRRAGVDARFDRQESEEEITITIQIPKQQAIS